MLLDKDNPFTRLVVVKAHSAIHHNGVKDTLTEVWSKFWIIQGRQFVRTVIGQCRLCRRLESVGYATQPSPPLPDFRTTMDYPFSYTGVDFAGPLYNEEGIHCTITCGVSRALHLDLVPDLLTEIFLRCFHRFCAQFGVP